MVGTTSLAFTASHEVPPPDCVEDTEASGAGGRRGFFQQLPFTDSRTCFFTASVDDAASTSPCKGSTLLLVLVQGHDCLQQLVSIVRSPRLRGQLFVCLVREHRRKCLQTMERGIHGGVVPGIYEPMTRSVAVGLQAGVQDKSTSCRTPAIYLASTMLRDTQLPVHWQRTSSSFLGALQGSEFAEKCPEQATELLLTTLPHLRCTPLPPSCEPPEELQTDAVGVFAQLLQCSFLRSFPGTPPGTSPTNTPKP
ncbi:unnamed protein product [Symbiodinium natans]|uniref:Uncharacterized protein n=1 Tax=Symbiodinium natans TaxID=878477 RepID=A0A812SR98_9DINO|nr:unnamed protein product [Symbiodinium natans]